MFRSHASIAQQILCLLLISLLLIGTAFGKPKGKNKGPQSADPAADVDLPDNANSASLRVNAIDTIYELDLTAAQLHSLRELAAGCGETSTRSAATVTPQFTKVLKDFQTALLEAKDDEQIAKLRNQVVDLMDSPDVHVDADIVTTAQSHSKAGAACSQLKASQIAAYLAVHAEDVSDPQELMMSTADGLHELHGEAAGKGGEKNADKTGDAASADSTIGESSLTVGYLVAGMDDAKAHAIAQQVVQWLRDADQLSETEFAARRQALEDSAKKIVGDVTPMQVLSNWMQDQMATLLSNPQLPEAIDAVLQSKEPGN